MKSEQFDEGFKAGVEAERKRIQSVEAQSLPGHEDLIAALKYDGHTTGEQAAILVIAEHKNCLATDQDVANDEGPAKKPFIVRGTATTGRKS